MELFDNKKINFYNFMVDFFNILKSKCITSLEINEFKKIIHYFKSLEKYNLIFENIELNIDDTLRMLQITRFIYIFDTNPNTVYIKSADSLKIDNDEFEKSLQELVDDYIFIIKNNNKYNNLNIYLCNTNNLSYKLVKGSNKNIDIKWNVITDGDLKEYEIIKDKKFYPDILCENVILYLNDLIIENILLKNSSFILNQGIINDIIVKNELYINNIDEQLINEISPYFISDNINNTKIKRLTLK